METKYVSVYMKDGHIVNRPSRPVVEKPVRTIDWNGLFWKATSFLAIVLLLVSVHIGCDNIELTQELSTELSETKVELAKVQEAYKKLVGSYWSEDTSALPVPNLPFNYGPRGAYADMEESVSLRAVYYSSGKVKPEVENSKFDLDSSIDTIVENVTNGAVDEVLNQTLSMHSYPSIFDNVPLDADLIEYIYTSAVDAGIKPEVMFALAWKESTFTIDLISSTNDYGLFQINQCNFGTLANHFGVSAADMPELLMDPYFNADCSIYMLLDIINNYQPENYHQALMMYNMGPGGARKCFANGSYSSEYSRKIANYAQENYGLTDMGL